MSEISFIGLGLHDEKGISLRGLEAVKKADNVFIELFTTLMPHFSIETFEELSGKRLHMLTREDLEEKDGEILLKKAHNHHVAFLVPGDPLIATTHIALRIKAEERGIRTRIIHGASILSAVISLSGLHNYKFGKSVTLPISQVSDTPYEVITQNKMLGLHTFCLLDINAKESHHMNIHEGIEYLLKVEDRKKRGIVSENTVAVGIARAGSRNPTVKADVLQKLLHHDFGTTPHSIIFPGKLHFMEAEALITLAKGPETLREVVE